MYENKGNILRVDSKTGQKTIIPQAEMQKLGIRRPQDHPDVHIPMDEFFKHFGGKK